VRMDPFGVESDRKKGGVFLHPAFCRWFALVGFALRGDGEDSLHAHIHIQFAGLNAGGLVGEPEGR